MCNKAKVRQSFEKKNIAKYTIFNFVIYKNKQQSSIVWKKECNTQYKNKKNIVYIMDEYKN